MTTMKDHVSSVVGSFIRLAKEDDPKRGALADLRSGLGRPPMSAHRMHPHLQRQLNNVPFRYHKWFYLSAALFGRHRLHQSGVSMGAAFGRLARGGSDSIEKRFLALLSCHADDLYKHISAAAGLLDSNKIPLDYYRLTQDLLGWSHEDNRVQTTWARDFYRTESKREKEND